MNIDKKLKNLGIENISIIDYELKENLVNKIADKLSETFLNANINKEKIVKKLINTNMYIADIPINMPKVNYIYMNSSIYFSKSLNLDIIDESIFHECIHKIQEYKNKKNRLIQLGTCNFTNTKILGLALNESAIQYIVYRTEHSKREIIDIYGIKIPTIGRNYYAMLTNLIEKIVFLIGEEELIDSTINCNDEFIYKCIDNFGEKTFYKIRDNFDKILCATENIIKNKKKSTNKDNLQKHIKELQDNFINTQEIITTTYFEKLLDRIDNLKEVEEYKEKLDKYRELIANMEKYDFYNTYYKNQYAKILEKEEKIKKSNALIVINEKNINRLLAKIKKLFTRPYMEYNK